MGLGVRLRIRVGVRGRLRAPAGRRRPPRSCEVTRGRRRVPSCCRRRLARRSRPRAYPDRPHRRGRAAAPALATDASSRCPSWPPWRGHGRQPSERRRRRQSPPPAAVCVTGGQQAAARALSKARLTCVSSKPASCLQDLGFEPSVAYHAQCRASRSYGSRRRPAARSAAGPTAAPSRREKTCGCPRLEGRRNPPASSCHVVRDELRELRNFAATTARLTFVSIPQMLV